MGCDGERGHTARLGARWHGYHEQAIEHYEVAIGHDPNLAQAKNNLAFLLATADEDLDRALDLAQEAKARLPDSPYAADTLGWVLYRRGIPSAAISYLKEAEAGRKVADLCREHGISEPTFYRWKSKYSGMEVSDAKKLRQPSDSSSSISRTGKSLLIYTA